MQVKVKLGNDWWLFPTDREFTKKELDLFSRVPIIAPLNVGENVRFFNIQKKKIVKKMISNIAMAYYQGFKPILKKDGVIVFKELGK